MNDSYDKRKLNTLDNIIQDCHDMQQALNTPQALALVDVCRMLSDISCYVQDLARFQRDEL